MIKDEGIIRKDVRSKFENIIFMFKFVFLKVFFVFFLSGGQVLCDLKLFEDIGKF